MSPLKFNKISAFSLVGKTYRSKTEWIFLIRFPESDPKSAPVIPCPNLSIDGVSR
jgi:hypothetical protein